MPNILKHNSLGSSSVGDLTQVKQLMNFTRNGFNLNNLINTNPQLKQVVELCRGRNPQDVFYEMCKQRGINPEDVLNQLR